MSFRLLFGCMKQSVWIVGQQSISLNHLFLGTYHIMIGNGYNTKRLIVPDILHWMGHILIIRFDLCTARDVAI